MRRIVEHQLDRARALLNEERDKLDSLAGTLLERETLDEADAYRAAGVERRPQSEAEPEASAASPSSAP